MLFRFFRHHLSGIRVLYVEHIGIMSSAHRGHIDVCFIHIILFSVVVDPAEFILLNRIIYHNEGGHRGNIL